MCKRELQNSSKISGDLNPNKEHTHDVGNDHRGDPRGGVGDLDGLGAVSIEREVHENDAHAAEHEHEAGREALHNVLPVDASREEHDGSNGAGGAVLRGADAGGLDDDVVDDSGNDHEVSKEDERVDGHRGGQG
jgi:hypothetical protein